MSNKKISNKAATETETDIELEQEVTDKVMTEAIPAEVSTESPYDFLDTDEFVKKMYLEEAKEREVQPESEDKNAVYVLEVYRKFYSDSSENDIIIFSNKKKAEQSVVAAIREYSESGTDDYATQFCFDKTELYKAGIDSDDVENVTEEQLNKIAKNAYYGNIQLYPKDNNEDNEIDFVDIRIHKREIH